MREAPCIVVSLWVFMIGGTLGLIIAILLGVFGPAADTTVPLLVLSVHLGMLLVALFIIVTLGCRRDPQT